MTVLTARADAFLIDIARSKLLRSRLTTRLVVITTAAASTFYGWHILDSPPDTQAD